MDFKQIAGGAIVGAITLFGLGFLMYEIMGGGAQLFDGSADGLRSEVLKGPIFLIDLATALLVTVIYNRWAGIKTFAAGAKNGLWIGALLGVIVQLDFYACTEVAPLNTVFFYAATHALRMAIAGGVIAWVLGKLNAN